MQTLESFNGQPYAGQADYFMWFSAIAFGGTNYSNTPVAAVTHTDEPHLDQVNAPSQYFSLWARGASFSYCAWKTKITGHFQAVGDPFVMK
ncbi:hypothetical protein EG834_22270 [bacterium]|nr:hypothetical protein [bacterium]